MKIAVASSDGIMVNQHFGKATRFLVFDGAGRLVEVRAVPRIARDPAEEGHLATLVEAVADCAAVVAMRIGHGAREALLERGIQPVEAPGSVEAALARLREEV